MGLSYDGRQGLLTVVTMSPAVETAVSSMLVSKTPGQLGRWLAAELTRRGYDLQRGGQSQFAREVGVAASIINRVLNDDRIPNTDALRRIGGALGKTLGEMLVIAGEASIDDFPVRPAPEPDLNDSVQRLADAASAEGRPLGELLLDHGIDANELVIPDAPPADPQIAEIESWDIPDEAKRRMIAYYLGDRAARFEEARRAREQRSGEK